MIRVLVVDDSAVCRALLRELLEADGSIQVVGEASTGEEAVKRSLDLRPDVVTMDVRMPGQGGLYAVSELMSRDPRAIVVVSEVSEPGSTLAFDAIRRGALDVVRKPSALDDDAGRSLRDLVRVFSRTPVVRHPGARITSRPPPRFAGTVGFLAIGASAGGPRALASLLPRLDDLACPIALAQHLPAGFASTFATFLEGRSRRKVVIATGPVTLAPDLLVLAADDRHLVMSGPRTVAPSDAPPRNGHRPSVDVLFESVASVCGATAAAVVLSGIGADGVEGMKRVREAGGLTLAQDEQSSAVFGMPRAAFERGAAMSLLDLDAIADRLRAGARRS